jgi:repressor LexA
MRSEWKGDGMTARYSILTSKQKKVYSTIEEYIKKNGIPPTIREIGEILGEKTPSAVLGILNRLEDKGVIKRHPGMARSIQIFSDEESMYSDYKYIPLIKRLTRRNIDDPLDVYNIEIYHPISTSFLKPYNEIIAAGKIVMKYAFY